MKTRHLLFSLAVAAAVTTSAHAALVTTTSTKTVGSVEWQVVTFNAGDGTWIVPDHIGNLEVLTVGGGGSGASWGSGGGAGGYYYTADYSAANGSSITVAVGAGGDGMANGGTSKFGLIWALGGQSFGASDGYRPLDELPPSGGYLVHGGNQGGTSTNGGVTITPGHLGGVAGWDGGFDSGAGAGEDGAHGNGSAGGDGLANSITGTLTYYAGGGGTVYGPGGLGGGGNSPNIAGAINSGGGGGGGLTSVAIPGGSGVVIVAYQAIPEPSAALLGGLGLLALLRRRR